MRPETREVREDLCQRHDRFVRIPNDEIGAARSRTKPPLDPPPPAGPLHLQLDPAFTGRVEDIPDLYFRAVSQAEQAPANRLYDTRLAEAVPSEHKDVTAADLERLGCGERLEALHF